MVIKTIAIILISLSFLGVTQYYTGFEEGALGIGSIQTIEGWYDNGSTGASITTSNVQYGTYALNLNATSGVACEAVIKGGSVTNSWWIQSGSNRTYSIGGNFRPASLPSAQRRMAYLANDASGRGAYLKWNTDGTISFFTTASGSAEYTSTLSTTVGAYNYICLRSVVAGSGVQFCGFTMTVGSVTESWTSAAYLTGGSPENITYLSLGDGTASAGTFNVNWDNIMINDNQTGDESGYPRNSFVANIPVNSDSLDGTWTFPDLSSGDLYTALNNLPYGKSTEDNTNTVVNVDASGSQALYLGFATPLSIGVTSDYDIVYYAFGVRYGLHTTTSAVTIIGQTTSNPTWTEAPLSNTTSGTAHSTADNNTTSSNWRTRYFSGGNALRQSIYLNTSTTFKLIKNETVATQVCVSKVFAVVRFIPAFIPKQR